MRVQADIISFIAVVIGAGLIGAIITWLLLRKRRKHDSPKVADGRETLYLVFSRIDHRLKTAGESSGVIYMASAMNCRKMQNAGEWLTERLLKRLRKSTHSLTEWIW